MKQFFRFLDDKLEEIVGVTILGVLVTMIFVGVVLRIGFTRGFSGQEELSRIFYVIVVYIGASYGMKTDDHIRVDVVVELLPERGRKILRIITDIIWAGFNISIIVFSMALYQDMQRFLGRSAMFDIPLHYIFLIIPLGFTLLTFRLIQSYFKEPNQKEEINPPENDAGPNNPEEKRGEKWK